MAMMGIAALDPSCGGIRTRPGLNKSVGGCASAPDSASRLQAARILRP